MSTRNFDLIVLGVGMAAVNAANKCASAGWSVAVVDELPYGGTCALRGCDPKKMLRRAAEIIDAARLMHGKGIEPNDIEKGYILDYLRSFRAGGYQVGEAPWEQGNESTLLESNGR